MAPKECKANELVEEYVVIPGQTGAKKLYRLRILPSFPTGYLMLEFNNSLKQGLWSWRASGNINIDR
jgi:hypothetical protein